MKPTYVYRCNDCSYEYEIEQRITEKPISKCPSCKSDGCERLICSPIVVSCGPQTLGTLAEKNTAQMGRYELEDKRAQNSAEKRQAADYIKGHKVIKPGKEKPWYSKANSVTPKKIRSMTAEQQKKFINEGKS